jgi:putative addiction module component (TIGR02574 family)
VLLTLEELGIDRLTPQERVMLAQEILETVDLEPAPSALTPAQREELRSRVADHLANPHDVVSWEEIQADIAKRYGA